MASTTAAPAPPSPAGSGQTVLIHVVDEVRKVTQDFRCPTVELLQHMKYFDQYLGKGSSAAGRDLDISVHCDVRVFDWLMSYVQSARDRRKLSDGTVVSLLVSSTFLQMAELRQECLDYLSIRLHAVSRLPINLSCLDNDILAGVAPKLTAAHLLLVQDKSGTFVHRLHQACLDRLLASASPRLHNLSRCRQCGKPVVPATARAGMCSMQAFHIDFNGNAGICHAADPRFTVARMLVAWRRKAVPWRDVYWRVWAMTHTLRCTVCDEPYLVALSQSCTYHPLPPMAASAAKADGSTPPIGTDSTAHGEGKTKPHDADTDNTNDTDDTDSDVDTKSDTGSKKGGDSAEPSGWLGHRYPCCGQPALQLAASPLSQGCTRRSHAPVGESAADTAVLETLDAAKDSEADLAMLHPEPATLAEWLRDGVVADSDATDCRSTILSCADVTRMVKKSTARSQRGVGAGGSSGSGSAGSSPGAGAKAGGGAAGAAGGSGGGRRGSHRPRAASSTSASTGFDGHAALRKEVAAVTATTPMTLPLTDFTAVHIDPSAAAEALAAGAAASAGREREWRIDQQRVQDEARMLWLEDKLRSVRWPATKHDASAEVYAGAALPNATFGR